MRTTESKQKWCLKGVEFLAILGCMVGLLVLSSPAQAIPAPSGEGSEDYRQWVTDAREAYDAGKYDEAAALLLKAFEKSADPNILYNLARCYQQDARHADAIRSYQEYGNLADTPEDKDMARKKIRDVMEAGKLGWVSVEVSGGTEVAIDDEMFQTLPMSRQLVSAGSHRLTIKGKREGTMVETIEVDVGEHMEVQLTFKPGQKSSTPAPPPASVQKEAAADSVSANSGGPGGIILLVSGGLVMGAGGLLLGLAHGDATNVENADVNQNGTVVEISRTDAQVYEESAKWKSITGVTALVAGGVGILAGTILMLQEPEAETTAAGFQSWVLPSSAGISFSGQF